MAGHLARASVRRASAAAATGAPAAGATQLVSFLPRPPPPTPPPASAPYAHALLEEATPGVRVGDAVYPFPRSLCSSMRGLVEAMGGSPVDKSWLDAALCEAPLAAASVTFLAPLPDPPSIICIGKNYHEHIKEVDTQMPGIARDAVPPVPIIFPKNTSSLCGPDASVAHPAHVSEKLDYEGELGVVIGVGGRNVSREDALDHVFGYTIINDITARDVQKAHQQWFLGKSMDGFCPSGPCIVPKAELAAPTLGAPATSPRPLAIVTRVNGEVRQQGSTSEMIRDVGDLIACISACVTLRPGDILATGTPAGVGAGFDPPRFLRPGDVVSVEVEGVGVLTTHVVPASKL